MSEGNRVFRIVTQTSVGLLVLGLIAIGALIWAVRIGCLPPTPAQEPTAEERFATRTPEEMSWISWLTEALPLQLRHKHTTLPISWYSLEKAEELGLSEVGLFYHIYRYYQQVAAGSAEYRLVSEYTIHFEHNLSEEILFRDYDSDGRVDRIQVRGADIPTAWTAFEATLHWDVIYSRQEKNLSLVYDFGLRDDYLSLNVFDRPTPGDEEWSYLQPLFDYADEIVSYLNQEGGR